RRNNAGHTFATSCWCEYQDGLGSRVKKEMQVTRDRLAPGPHINTIGCGEKPCFLDRFLVGPFCGAMKVFEVLGAISISDERHKPVGDGCGKEATDYGYAETDPNVFPDLF